jgi:hypothetical protein
MNDVTRQPRRRLSRGWLHFGLATALLLIVAVGWSLAMRQLGIWTAKKPISWPEGVQVDSKDFKNISLPERFGPYRMVEDIDQKEDILETLKIGTMLDRQRYNARQSNWYVTRLYEDTREDERSPYRYWYLDLVFYTGGETTVPHVPDICAQAGGARLIGREVQTISVPKAQPPWKNNTPMVALSYERTYEGKLQQFVQYYLFCINGLPEEDRNQVRLRLLDLWKRYVYYAKLQFFPPAAVRGNLDQADEKAAEFLRHAMPAVLSQLPTAERMEQINESGDPDAQ